jgi:alpha(1,3/1,4) fucosyltransferase
MKPRSELITVSLVLFDDIFLDNRIFTDDHRDNCTDVWSVLHDFLLERDVLLQTWDKYGVDKEQSDYHILINFTKGHIKYILKQGLSPRKCIIRLIEPLVIAPFSWRYIKYYSKLFPIILTWDDSLVGKRPFQKLYIPQNYFDQYTKAYSNVNRDKSVVFIVANKTSSRRGELYSKRLEIIKYFEANAPEYFDLYGYGWNNPVSMTGELDHFSTTLYGGEIISKHETLKRYKYSMCIENSSQPGYITEKLFDALFAGCVPIYYGAPNINKYIPNDCFIDMRLYKNLGELHEVIRGMSNEEWKAMQMNGRKFIESKLFKPFNVESFCMAIYNAIQQIHKLNAGVL